MSKEGEVEWLRGRVAELESENRALKEQLVRLGVKPSPRPRSLPVAPRPGSSRSLSLSRESEHESRPSPLGGVAARPKYRPSTASTDGSSVDDTAEASCNNCGSLVPLRNMQNHVLHCYRTMFKCPMCSEPVEVKKKEQHMQQERGTPSMLEAACAQDKLGLVSRMVAHGASVHDAVNEAKDAPIHVASRSGNVLVLQFLLSKGADVNKTNGRGETALHLSCSNKKLFEVSAYLLSQGADTSVATPMGDTALELAQRHHNTEIALLISRHSRSARPGSSRGMLRPQSGRMRSRPSNRPQMPPPGGGRRPSMRGRRTQAAQHIEPIRAVSPIMSPRR